MYMQVVIAVLVLGGFLIMYVGASLVWRSDGIGYDGHYRLGYKDAGPSAVKDFYIGWCLIIAGLAMLIVWQLEWLLLVVSSTGHRNTLSWLKRWSVINGVQEADLLQRDRESGDVGPVATRRIA